MEKELVKRENQIELSNKENLDLIKSMFAKNASESELNLFLYMSKKYQLDIMTKQIWLIKYGNNPASIYAGRDGFLAIAHRSGKFDGMTTEINGTGPEMSATCKVYRSDMKYPISVTVYFSEYTTDKNLWNTKPRTMIGKVAESQALRRAFDISGIYDPDEVRTDPQPEKDITPNIPAIDTNTGEIKQEKKTNFDNWFSQFMEETRELFKEYNNVLPTDKKMNKTQIRNYAEMYKHESGNGYDELKIKDCLIFDIERARQEIEGAK